MQADVQLASAPNHDTAPHHMLKETLSELPQRHSKSFQSL